jgi:hypothetical protein
MSKMRLNTMLSAPVFPLLLELRAMIRQNSLLSLFQCLLKKIKKGEDVDLFWLFMGVF